MIQNGKYEFIYDDGATLMKLDFHFHDYYEFYFFIDGEVDYHIEESCFHMTHGDVLIIPPEKLHRPVFHNSNTVYDRKVIWISKEYLSRLSTENFNLVTELSNLIEKTPLIHFSDSEFDSLLNNIYLFEKHSKSTYRDADLMCNAYCSILIQNLFVQSKKSKKNEPKYLGESSLSYTTVQNVITYINENLTSNLSVSNIANKFFISKFHLLRLFKDYTQVTMYNYIISKRIILAKQLIESGTPLSSVYTKCGFSNYSSFYKAFMNRLGCSPKNYKKGGKEG